MSKHKRTILFTVLGFVIIQCSGSKISASMQKQANPLQQIWRSQVKDVDSLKARDFSENGQQYWITNQSKEKASSTQQEVCIIRDISQHQEQQNFIDNLPDSLKQFNSRYEEPVVQLYSLDVNTLNYVPESNPTLEDANNYYYWDGEEHQYNEYEPEVVQWDNYYHEPSVDLYIRDEETGQYYEIEEPSPYLSYSYFDQESNEFIEYEPVKRKWNEYYEQPIVDLYYVDVPTGEHVLDWEPSPLVQYQFFDEKTQDYQDYMPQPAVWTDYYDAPEVDIFSWDETTNKYVSVQEPSPYKTYQVFNEQTQKYENYEPSPVHWTDYYQPPQDELYYYDEPTGKYVIDYQPSPFVQYYTLNESTQEYVSYQPVVTPWTDYYEVPAVDLYKVDECTGEFKLETKELSVARNYFFYNESSKDFVPFEPIAPVWTDYFEPTKNTLLKYDEQVKEYVVDENHNPYLSHYIVDEETNEFVLFEPTPAKWTNYHVEPVEEIYYFDKPTQQMIPIAEPSPYGLYYTQNEEQNIFELYQPINQDWSYSYEEPTVQLFKYNELTSQYIEIENPNPLESYFYKENSTGQFIEYTPDTGIWTDYYEPPHVDLYVEDVNTFAKKVEDDPNPYVDHYIFNEDTQCFSVYEPEIAVWTNHFEPAPVDLYYHDDISGQFIIDNEPSPYIPYYYFDQNTLEFQPYEPTPPVWLDYFEEPTVQLYIYDETKESYNAVDEPSPLDQHYFFKEDTREMIPFNPQPTKWTDYYEIPDQPLLIYDESIQNYVEEPNPSPYLNYYIQNETTQEFIEFEPSPISWNSYYEEPRVDLFYYDEATNKYVLDENPSPNTIYYQIEPQVNTNQEDVCINEQNQQVPVNNRFIEYEPTPITWSTFNEPSPVPLFTFNENTNQYVVEPNPSPFEQYYFLNESTRNYIEYEPTPKIWTNYFEEPEIPVFSFKEGTFKQAEQLEYSSVYYYEAGNNGEMAYYTPQETNWNDYYATPVVELYERDEGTGQLMKVVDPSPYQENLLYYNQESNQYETYEPNPIKWTSVNEPAGVDLYYYDQDLNTFKIEQEPSPAVNYYTKEAPNSFKSYEPTPVQWEKYYEKPATILYGKEESTNTFYIADKNNLSPYQNYYVFNEGTQDFNHYVPVQVPSTAEQLICVR